MQKSRAVNKRTFNQDVNVTERKITKGKITKRKEMEGKSRDEEEEQEQGQDEDEDEEEEEKKRLQWSHFTCKFSSPSDKIWKAESRSHIVA